MQQEAGSRAPMVGHPRWRPGLRIKDAISQQVLAGLDAAGIGIASAAYDVVGLPPVRFVPVNEPGHPRR